MTRPDPTRARSSWFDPKRLTFLTVFALLVGACADEERFSPQLETIRQPNILHPMEWNTISSPAWTFDAIHRRLMIAGEAIADTESCSGFLIDDEWVVTAHHCVDAGETNREFQFAHWGSTASTGNYSTGYAVARRRLERQFGFTSQALAALDNADFTRFTCLLDQHARNSAGGYRDVAYFKCQPKFFWNGSQTVFVLPGHLFRHLDVSTAPGAFQPVYALSSNAEWNDTQPRENLLSPDGFITSTGAASGCGYQNQREALGVDTERGSSGGAWLRESSYSYAAGGRPAVWGVNSCARNKVEPDAAGNYYVHPNSTTYANLPSTLDSNAAAVSSTPAVIDPGLPTQASDTWLPYVGGTGGTERVLYCPFNYFAVGVMGSTSEWSNVGNLALICAPYQTSYGQLSPRQNDRFVVISAGSHDTTMTPTPSGVGADYNTYHSNVLSTKGSGVATTLIEYMCPPRHYMSGMTSRATTTRLARVSAIQCEHVSQWSWPSVTQPLDDVSMYRESSLGNATGTVAQLSCPSGSVIRGMRVRAGWETDGFNPICRTWK